MKKIIYSLGVILVVAIVALLYTHATAFQIRNVEKMIVSDSDYSFDLTDDVTKEFILKLQALKQYELDEPSTTVLSKTIELDMKYSQNRSFKIDLDHDFSYFYITDLKDKKTYKVDDMVTWVYMLPPFDGVYTYKSPIRHDVIINDQKISSHQVDYFYKKADDSWISQLEAQEQPLETFVITEPNVNFTVKSNYKSVSVDLRVYKNDELIYEHPLENGIYQPVYNGDYVYEVSSEWIEDLYYGSETTQFIIKANYPPDFIASSDEIYQGEFISLKALRIAEPEKLYVSDNYMPGLSFEKNGDVYECLIPSTYYTTPGVYTIQYGIEGYDYEHTFEVKAREFNYQHLTVSKSTTASTQTAEAYAEYNKYYKPALLKNVFESKSSHLTEQAFVLPVSGRLTTEFGVQRYVNEKLTSYNHSGLDIAIDRGTEIVSTYDGQVVLSMFLKVTGNTVVISHGNGIFSSYLHMDSLNVEENDIVKTGDLIGTVGSTGFSTGPHLHFTISYYKMNLEPGYFIYGQAVTYDNYKSLFDQ